MPNAQLEEAKRQLEAAIAAISDGRAAPGPPQAQLARPLAAAPARDPLQTLTRLAIGVALLGIDELERRAPGWERQAAGDGALAPEPPQMEARPATPGDLLRYALAGWVFASQDRLRAAQDVGGWLREASGQLMDTVGAITSETLSAGRGPDGEVRSEDIAGWIERGRAEEQRSRAVARVALAELTRDAMDYLANDQAVQELVQSHSGGLVEETLDEVRERAVSADMALNRLVGRILRRPADTKVHP